MAYYVANKKKRTYSSSKKTYKKRKFNMVKKSRYGKIGYFRLMRWSNADGVNHCHITLDPLSVTSSGQLTTVFQLSHLAGNAEITALFDNYRMTMVKYRWVCIRNPDFPGTGSTVSGTQGLYPRLTWVHDFNDSTAITRTQMMQHASLREHWFTDSRQATRWYTLKPASLTVKYETPALTAYNPQWGSWVDTNDNLMNHYGIKYAWSELQAGVTLRLEAKVYLECKGIS